MEKENNQKTELIKKDKLKSWLSNPYNLLIIILILFAIGLRWHYFEITKNQPLWWDEASYMAAAKDYAGIGDYQLESIRLPGFPLTMSLFFKIGVTNEVVLRFFGLFLPSILMILLIYFMFSQMYGDKRVGLISAAIITVLWENAFYSNRFHTENFALIFEFLALIVVVRYYISEKKNLGSKRKLFNWALIFVLTALSVVYRSGNALFVPGMIAFILIMELGPKFKRKGPVFIGGFIIFLFLIGFLLLKLFSTNPLISAYYFPDQTIPWSNLSVFYGFYQSLTSPIPSIFFFTFLIGVTTFLYELYLYLPELKCLRGSKNNPLKADLLNALVLLSVLAIFLLLIRPAAFEFRWFFPLLPGMLAFTSKGAIKIADYFGKVFLSKKLGTTLLIIIICLGMYTQMARTEPLIISKVTSYQQVKDIGLWLNENSLPNEVIMSSSYPQVSYYSERKTVNYAGMTQEEFESYLVSHEPEYLIISIFETNPQWLQNWLNENQKLLEVKQAYFADQQHQQPILIIYKLSYS